MKAPYHPCPDDEVLQEVAAGLAAQELAERTWQHASRCAICGPALKRYVRDFSDEPRPENARILAQLKSSTPEWQRRLVREFGTQKRARWPRFIPVFAAFTAVLVAVLLGPPLFQAYKLNQAKKEVAAAFAERRTVETRLAGADYSKFDPFPTELGPERSVDSGPLSLHKAFSAALENLQKPSADHARYLQVMGRAFLWEATPGSLEKAEKNFEKARAEGLNTPDLEIDLAAAYYARDNNGDHPNLQRTLDLLNKVLTEPKLGDQDRASALFNLALAYERTQAWDLAAETWERYLKVDSSSGWAEEAKENLKKDRTKLQRPAAGISGNPADFLKQVAEGTANERVEEYLDTALISWLPEGVERQNSDAWTATERLANILATRHKDLWLADVIASVNPATLPAVRALAAALQDNGAGDYNGAKEQARNAAALFARSRSPAGAFRAKLEEVSALRRTLNGPDCLARAEPLAAELSATRYFWLQARLAVEKAECENLTGTFTEADASLNSSQQIAIDSDFPNLALRDIGMTAGNLHLRGNCRESWRQAVSGISLYWQRAFTPSDRLYQFYSVMYQCALQEGALFSGEALLRHSLALRESSSEIKKNAVIEGALHLQLAHVLLARGMQEQAEQETRKSAELLQAKPLPQKIKLILDLEPAQFYLQQGDARQAIATLEPLAILLSKNPDSFFSLRYYDIRAGAQFKLGQLDEAAASYKNAIDIAESAFNNIDDWTVRLQWLHATDESYRGLVRVLLRQNKTEEALDVWELYRSRSVVNTKISRNFWSSLGEKPVRFDDTAPRIVYAEFDDGLEIWAASQGQIRGTWVKIDKHDVDNPTQQFIELCSSDRSKLEEIHELGKKLFGILLEPVASALPPSGELIIELDTSSYNLPMEALWTGDGKYLGEKYSITYSPGIWIEKELRAPLPITGRESLMLVDATHTAKAGDLPGFAAQRARIVELFPRAQVIDTVKTEWSITRTRLPFAQLVHIMTHGRPDGSGTSLDYDAHRSLRALDFAPKSLGKAEMVVLAACSGAAGREFGIADTGNLVRAFLGAGVPSVVASHWNVDAAATSQLMESFYGHLRNRESIARAMYNARIEMLHTNPHPYYWAGFGLSGRASPGVRESLL
jgi:pentatricopeptide repeat protein